MNSGNTQMSASAAREASERHAGGAHLDPILFAVLSGRIKAIAEQMAFSVMHSARSTLLVEGRDFSVGIYDPEGVAIQQIEFIPLLGFAVGPSMKCIVDAFRGDVHEGDLFIHNDVYTGGSQLADVKVARPVFLEGELIAWTAVNAHQADIGGAVAGGYNPDATEIWQEAFRITPTRIYDRGKKIEDVWDLIFANIRLSVVVKDLEAAIGGCTIGERELVRVAAKYGAPAIRLWMQETLDMAERLIRDEIKRMRKGVFHGSAVAVFDGVRPGSTLPVEIDVVVEEDRLVFDFEGSAAQSPGYVNAPLSATVSSVMLALSMVLGEHIPRNEGVLRAVDIRVTRGSFLNPEFPAATGYGNHLCDHIVAAVMTAFEKIRPQDAVADWSPGRTGLIVYKDPRTGATKVSLLTYANKGGSGAVTGADGYDHVSIIAAGGVLATTDPEMVEIHNPHFFHRFELNEDSCGHGRWRGGLGTHTEMELLWSPVLISFYGDGEDEGTCARGILGGGDGKRNELELVFPDGHRISPRIKGIMRDIPAGTVWRQIRGGGGGCGDPRERDRELVVRDVVNGFIAEETAREVYGLEEIPSVAEYHRAKRRASA
ncbi:MAG: hydantoinase B/oxoprolinase family protein [Chloroflexi bacterium]|nr:hydantoinase B/oxoprolinase family protein [Chloroflexota bacterium]